MDRRAVVHALFFEAIFQLKNNNQIDRVLDWNDFSGLKKRRSEPVSSTPFEIEVSVKMIFPGIFYEKRNGS